MGIWKMSQLKAPPLTDDPAQLREYIKYLSNQLASMLKDLDFTLNGDVDFRNVRAKSIKADNLNVTELSAITANMGKLTSGEIYGAYISTVEDAVPRCEMSATGNIFSALSTEGNKISIDPNYGGVPALDFYLDGIVLGKLDTTLGSMELLGNGSLIIKSVGGNIELSSTGVVSIQNWDKFFNETTGRTLQQDLDSINSSISGLASAISSLDARVSALESP